MWIMRCRKPLDKILELGKETGWVIAYEPDTKAIVLESLHIVAIEMVDI